MTVNSMQHAPGRFCRFVLAGPFREVSRWAARADLSLREWVMIETDGPLMVFEMLVDPELLMPYQARR
jgi:hypothetical protein